MKCKICGESYIFYHNCPYRQMYEAGKCLGEYICEAGKFIVDYLLDIGEKIKVFAENLSAEELDAFKALTNEEQYKKIFG